jgi:N-acetylglucosamine-6-phosphate deacetylase
MGLSFWGAILTDSAEQPPARVIVDGGRIVAVESAGRPRQGDVVIEPGEGWIAPGLVDLQVNGAGGVDLTAAVDTAKAKEDVGGPIAASPAVALHDVARTLAMSGVTAFCPTIVSSPLPTIVRALEAYGPRVIHDGAESLGAHVEGPFIDPDHRGVHDPAVLRPASETEIHQWLAHGTPAIVTLAPEQPGAMAAIGQLNAAGTVVSLGHSGATAEQASAALTLGARMATHLFNAMPPLHHRQPGLVGALLASSAQQGLIADGVHVDPMVVDLVVRRAGTRRVVLVSDALAAAGIPPGLSRLGNQTVRSDGRVVQRLDGTLAGSAMLLPQCLKNVRAWFPDMPPATLIEMASRTPARLLRATRKGRVAVGCDADLVLLAPDFSVRQSVLRGELLEVRSTT